MVWRLATGGAVGVTDCRRVAGGGDAGTPLVGCGFARRWGGGGRVCPGAVLSPRPAARSYALCRRAHRSLFRKSQFPRQLCRRSAASGAGGLCARASILSPHGAGAGDLCCICRHAAGGQSRRVAGGFGRRTGGGTGPGAERLGGTAQGEWFLAGWLGGPAGGDDLGAVAAAGVGNPRRAGDDGRAGA